MASPPKADRPARRSIGRWRRRLLIAAPIALVLYALGGFFAVPWALQRWAVPAANDQLNGTLAVDTFRCNPFALSLTLEGVAVQDATGTRVLGLGRFYGNLQASSLVRRGWVFRAVEVDRPFVQAELLEDGRINLAGLVRAADPTAPEPEAAAAPPADGPPKWPRVRVGRVAVTDAHLMFMDQMIAEDTFRFEINPLTFVIPKLDTLADHKNPHRLHAVADGGAEFDWEGTVFMNPLTSDGRLTVRGVDLSLFQPYVGRFSALHLNQGTLGLDLSYGMAPAAAPARVGLELRTFAVDGLRVEQDGVAVVEGLNLAVAGLSVDAVARTARLERVATGDATLRLVREADGGLTLARAVKADAFGPPPTTPADTVPMAAPDPALDPAPDPAPDPGEPAAPAPWTPVVEGIDRVVNDLLQDWDVQVESVAVERYALRLTDASTPTPADVRLQDVTLTAGPIRSAEGYDVPFTLSLAQATPDGGSFDPGPGTLGASGRAGMQNLTAEIETTIAGLDLTPAGPYVTWAMPGATLPSGRIGLRGKATVDAGGDPAQTPGGLRSATFNGEFDLDALRVDGAVAEAPLLSCETLAVRGIAFDHAASTLDIATLEGDGLTGAVAFDLGGGDAEADSGAGDAAAGAAEAADSAETGAATNPDAYQPLALNLPYRVRVGRLHQTGMDALVLVDGVDPPLRFASTDGELTVKELDLGPDAPAPAALAFKTRLQDSGRFTLSGTLAPDVADLNNSRAQLDYQLDNLPLAPFSGLSARYVGRKLASGKLSLGNAVTVGDFKFNTVVPLKIENFELGEKVKSPDAVKLPLDLAVAILKDSKGNIKPPDVPVAGPLDDPSVSVGKLIWYAVGNLIKSIVAAPFNLLGGALAGGDGAGGASGGGMPAVAFAPGSSQPGPDAAEPIEKLAAALADRPALGLQLVAVPAPAGVDETALRRNALRAQIATRDGGAPPNDARYAQAIAAWYAETHPDADPGAGPAAPARPEGWSAQDPFPTPQSAPGAAAASPPAFEAMEAWALDRVDLDRQAVVGLSAQRIEAVRAALIAAGMDASRLITDAVDQGGGGTSVETDGIAGPAVRFEAAVP